MVISHEAESNPRHVLRSGLLVWALAAFLLAGCGDFSRGMKAPEGGSPLPPTNGTGDGEADWVADVHPILIDRCVQCHTANFSAMPLTRNPDVDFNNVIAFVVPGVPEASSLLLKGRALVGHGGGRTLELPRDAREIAIIEEWILGGALP